MRSPSPRVVWGDGERGPPGCGGQSVVEVESASGVEYASGPPLVSSEAVELETVLVIEEEPSLLRLLRRVLERAGLRVLATAHGEAAVELCDAWPGRIDLVIANALAPGAGRWLDLVHRRCPGARMLLMSCLADDDLGVRPRSRPLDPNVLHKPFSSRELVAAVRRTLDG